MFFDANEWVYVFVPGNTFIIAWPAADQTKAIRIDAGATLGASGDQKGDTIFWMSDNGTAVLVLNALTNKMGAQIQP